MTGLLFLFGLFLVLGLFFLAASILRLPIIGTVKAMLGDVKQERKAAKTIEACLMIVIVRLAEHIHMDECKRSRVHNVLKVSDMNLTPGVCQVYASVEAGTILLGVVPCMFFLPFSLPVVIILSLFTYLKESQKTDERLKAKRDEIEGELPRLVTTIKQELKASRSVIGMLERFEGNAGAALTGELDILLADMRPSNYEAAPTRFEVRLNSPMFSDVVRGPIEVLRGNDDSVYFQMLAHDFKQLELQRLKTQVQKIPSRIRVFLFAMLMCFLLTYLITIVYVAVTSLGGMFQERREAIHLKEWIESRPQGGLNMMMPGGYVFLTPKWVKELSERKGMKAHLGILGYDITVSAEGLLTQNVVSVKWNGTVCHILAGYIQKEEPELPAPGQGAVMY